MRPLILFAALAVAASWPGADIAALAQSAQASRPRAPTAEELTRVEAALRAAGYTEWDDVEVREDTGVIEVDDAKRGSDGREVDLKIEAATMRILEDRGD